MPGWETVKGFIGAGRVFGASGEKHKSGLHTPEGRDLHLSYGQGEHLLFFPSSEYVSPLVSRDHPVTYAFSEKPKSDPFHVTKTNDVIRNLGLEVCADTIVARCSGGQQKRVSIALELVAKPSFLVLDEPTSGLDSAASLMVIEILSKIAKENVVVIVSIHQPNWITFNTFDKIYLLTRLGGKTMFEGRPDRVPQHLHNFQISFSKENNPADILMEVASGCFGPSVIKVMNHGQIRHHEDEITRNGIKGHNHPTLASVRSQRHRNFWKKVKTIFWRYILITMRDPFLLGFRFLATLMAAAMVFIFWRDAGKGSGCPPDISSNDTYFGPGLMEELNRAERISQLRAMENSSLLLYVVCLNFFFGILPVLMTFPPDVPVLEKECFNNCYTVLEYYMGKLLAEAPFHIFFMLVFIITEFHANQQPSNQFFRICLFILVHLILVFNAQAFGYMMTSFWIDDIETGVKVTVTIFMVFLAYSGFFVPSCEFDSAIFYVSYILPLRAPLEGSLLAIFGFDRCGDHPEPLRAINRIQQAITMDIFNMRDQMVQELSELDSFCVDQTSDQQLIQFSQVISHAKLDKYISKSGRVVSSVISRMCLEDTDFGPIIVFMLCQFLIFRTIAFMVINSRINRTK